MPRPPTQFFLLGLQPAVQKLEDEEIRSIYKSVIMIDQIHFLVGEIRPYIFLVLYVYNLC